MVPSHGQSDARRRTYIRSLSPRVRVCSECLMAKAGLLCYTGSEGGARRGPQGLTLARSVSHRRAALRRRSHYRSLPATGNRNVAVRNMVEKLKT